MNTFYLGTHRPTWLADPRFATVPLFVSRSVLTARQLPRAVGRYAIDSGAFSELQRHGRWTITPAEYVAFLRRVWREVGPFDFAAPMDWMCEPIVITGGHAGGVTFAGTGLSVPEHQRRTVDNLLQLRTLAPDLPIAPVVQGWTVADYLRCVDLYRAAGVDLTREPVVGVGSVCRRQGTAEAADIIGALYDAGITTLHGFGFKILGLRACWADLATADSMAWSLDGRRAGPCAHPPYATGRQPNSEANCRHYALAWARRHIHPPARDLGRQLSLFATEVA